ncbi:MAG: NAD(P)H-binding protein [candidate division Zixibacteria bacterium]|nr:NAD(P)H-binding protein [candidate division Zixibacteria bacterium]
MYAICGATGNIGRIIAERLLDQGRKVRVIGRNAKKLQPLADRGADAIVADLTDTKAITKAFTGATAVYVLIPPNMTAKDVRKYQNRIGESITTAIKNSGVRHVVNLSSVGAHKSEGMGIVNGLYDQEQRLNKLEGVNVLHLRPSFFMENHLWQLNTIKEHGMLASTMKADTPVAQIATADIAEFAVKRITDLDFTGKVTRELLGPNDVTMTDVATAIGTAIGTKNLNVQQVSLDDTRKHMLGMGASESVVDSMIELYEAVNKGTWSPTEQRRPENTTPTTIEAFSRTFSTLYEKQ